MSPAKIIVIPTGLMPGSSSEQDGPATADAQCAVAVLEIAGGHGSGGRKARNPSAPGDLSPENGGLDLHGTPSRTAAATARGGDPCHADAQSSSVATPGTPEIDSDRLVSVARTPRVGVEDEDGPDGRKQSATHSEVAVPPALDTLHAVLGLYARELLDLQKLRVAQGNRVAAMERDGLPEEFVEFARDTLETLAKKEKALNAYLGRQVTRHPLAPWIKAQRGIGLPGFARLIGITGPLSRFSTVSKLWAYLGMHVVDGHAPKRRKGEKANWSPAGRVLCHQLGDSIVKMGKGGEYRAAYDATKARYEAERPDWTQAHRHNAASRYAVKSLLKAMWLAHRAYERGETP